MTNKFPAIKIITGSIADRQFYPKGSLIDWVGIRVRRLNGTMLLVTKEKDGFYVPMPDIEQRNELLRDIKEQFKHTGYMLQLGHITVYQDGAIFEKDDEKT